MSQNKSVKMTGLWEQTIKDGRIVLKGRMTLQQIEQAIENAREIGLDLVSVEIWPNQYRERDSQPSHVMRLTEPYTPPAKQQSARVPDGEPYPF